MLSLLYYYRHSYIISFLGLCNILLVEYTFISINTCYCSSYELLRVYAREEGVSWRHVARSGRNRWKLHRYRRICLWIMASWVVKWDILCFVIQLVKYSLHKVIYLTNNTRLFNYSIAKNSTNIGGCDRTDSSTLIYSII